MTGLRYVYAVCRPFGTPLQAQLTGVAGDPPRALTHHGLVAVVSHVPERDFAEEPLRAHLEDLDWLTETARAHQGVIDALTTVTTPLPLRLGTVFHDDSGVRTMMEAREEDFQHTLDRLEGRVEWGVKVYAESAPQESARPAQKPASGRDYLRQRRMQTRSHEDMWQKAGLSRPDCTRSFPHSRRIPGCIPPEPRPVQGGRAQRAECRLSRSACQFRGIRGTGRPHEG